LHVRGAVVVVEAATLGGFAAGVAVVAAGVAEPALELHATSVLVAAIVARATRKVLLRRIRRSVRRPGPT
jgi:hypothetical protein